MTYYPDLCERMMAVVPWKQITDLALRRAAHPLIIAADVGLEEAARVLGDHIEHDSCPVCINACRQAGINVLDALVISFEDKRWRSGK